MHDLAQAIIDNYAPKKRALTTLMPIANLKITLIKRSITLVTYLIKLKVKI